MRPTSRFTTSPHGAHSAGHAQRDIVVAEKCLNHTLGGLIDTYDRGDYLKERLEALDKLSQFLVACEEGRPVITEPLRQAA